MVVLFPVAVVVVDVLRPVVAVLAAGVALVEVLATGVELAVDLAAGLEGSEAAEVDC